MCKIILLLTVIITTARAFTSFYVVPNLEDRSHLCHPDVYCYSFQEIVNNQSDYFTSNTVLELSPGIYNIYRELNLHIANVTNFELRSSDMAQYYGNNSYFSHNNSKVEINCKPHVTFRMTLSNSSNLTFKDVMFSNCFTEEKYNYMFYVLHCLNVSLSNTAFVGNQGTISVQNSEIEFKGQSVFCNNSAKDYESFLVINESSKVIISGEACFIGNTARSGGALLVHRSTVHINTKKVMFVRNTANTGGAIVLKNQAKLYGYVKKIVFRENKANQYGGAVYANKSNCYLSGEIEFQLNMARSGGAITLKDKSELHFNVATPRLLIFNGNNAMQYGGAIFIDHSKLCLSGNAHLGNNSANYGGAMGFIKGHLVMSNNTNITISQNYAGTYGGGVYVDDDAYYSWEETRCFVSCDENTCFNSVIKFEDNQALSAGSALFGGWIDVCLSLPNVGIPNFQYDNESNDLSIISSYPTRICLCTNSMINETTEYHAELYPGQTLHIEAVAIGTGACRK